jgi:hypothetical protein
MSKNTAVVATALGAALAASLIGMAGPASAAIAGAQASTTSAATKTHVQKALAHWKAGSAGTNAQMPEEFRAARKELAAAKGDRFWHEQDDLTALINIPGTQTTAKQRATVKRVTRELNGFFHTPGRYSIKPGNARKIARADWIKSHQVVSARANVWVAATIDELDSYKGRYAKQRTQLTELLAIPLTDTTAKQQAIARRNTRALNRFFKVTGAND